MVIFMIMKRFEFMVIYLIEFNQIIRIKYHVKVYIK